MPYHHRLIDISKLPPNAREGVIRVAEAFNAFIPDIHVLKKELEEITGNTEEVKQMVFRVFGLGRSLAQTWHSTKGGVTMLLICCGILIHIMEHLGIHTQTLGPELFHTLQNLDHILLRFQ